MSSNLDAWVFDQFYWSRPGEDRLLFPFPGDRWDAGVGIRQYQDHLQYLIRADELGFDGICVTEHHFTHFGLPSPNLIAAALAVKTSHAKLVLMGNCLPLHPHPVRLAEELAMIDVLSNGRLVSGMLRGGSSEWYSYNVNPDTVRECFEEAWQLIIDCWTEPQPFAWHGKHFDYDTVSITPRPVQKPYPPLIMGASTAESIEWCARKRVPLACSFAPTDSMKENFEYYREYARKECGWSPGPEHALFSRQIYVAPTNEQARREAGPHLSAFWGELRIARELPEEIERYRRASRTERSFAYKKGKAAGAQFMKEAFASGEPPNLDWLIEHGMAIVGDPEMVTKELKYQQEQFGAGTVMIYSPFATLPVDLATKSMELFAREVLPNLRAAVPA